MTTIHKQPHVLVIPYPAQGHVMPFMKLSYCLADRGVKITFVNIESIHTRLIEAELQKKGEELDHINLVSVSDGLTPEDRKDASKLHRAINTILPAELEKLIKRFKYSEHGEIACIIADPTLVWSLDIARKMGVRRASFFAASAGVMAITLQIPKLIELGVIDETGAPMKDDKIFWSPDMPGIKPNHLMWQCTGGMVSPQIMFHLASKRCEASKSAEWVFCNTFDEIEHAAIKLVPNLLPIGPILASNHLGNFWPEDLTCLSWLDGQETSSVIYISFGSIASLNQPQFEELALGLELLGRPFLWVVRSGLDLYGRPNAVYPDGFRERVAQLGKIVSWAPQQKVLAHPSIACFVSHCGWNSIIEGVSTGVRFICWPYFSDQFLNATYVADAWRVGLELNLDQDGIVSRNEIERKVNQLLGDEEIKENSQKLKEMATNSVGKDGHSTTNLEQFVEELKR